MNHRSLLTFSLGMLLLCRSASAQPDPSDCKVQPENKAKAEALVAQMAKIDKDAKGEIALFDALNSLGISIPDKLIDVLKKRGNLRFAAKSPGAGAGTFTNTSSDGKETVYDWFPDIRIPSPLNGTYAASNQGFALSFTKGTSPYARKPISKEPGIWLNALKVSRERIDVVTSTGLLDRCVVFQK